MSKIRAVTATLLVCCCLPATAGAAQTVTLHTSFSPDRLGASTTIGFGFQIASTSGGLPSPLTGLSLHLPPGIDYVTTTLGLSICQPASLLWTRSLIQPRASGSGARWWKCPSALGRDMRYPTSRR